MKRTLAFITAGVVSIASIGLWFYFRGDAESLPPIVHAGEDIVVSRDGNEIFRRAFWRHPSEQDKIVQAERREWKDQEDQGVTRWQWFLELRPSAELMKTIQSESGFGMRPVPTPSPWAKQSPAPHWFPTNSELEDLQVFQSPSGALTLLHHPEDNVLFATDEGLGFTSPHVPIPERKN